MPFFVNLTLLFGIHHIDLVNDLLFFVFFNIPIPYPCVSKLHLKIRNGVVACKRNRAVTAVIVEVKRIITLYHGYQVVIGVIVIMSIALLCTQAVDVVMPASVPVEPVKFAGSVGYI